MWAGSVFFVDLSFYSRDATIPSYQVSSRLAFRWTLLAIFLLTLLPYAYTQNTHPDPNDIMAQAATARADNDLAKAIVLYSQVVEINPNLSDAWWYLGSSQYATGAYDQARDALSHYLELSPKAAPALALRGLCEFETGDYADALQDIQRGISLGAANQPRNEQILRYHEGLLLTRLANYAGALKVYSYFARNDIRSPELMLAIGLAGLHKAELPQDIAPDQKDRISSAGEAAFAFMKGDDDSAAQAFQELFRRFPEMPYVHFLYGYLLFSTDPDAALGQFRQELKVSPANNIDASVMTAWALLLQNRPADALPFAQTAEAKEPGNPTAQLVLGRALLDTGDVNGGMKFLTKLVKEDPNNLEAHIALAEAYSKSGHKEEAYRERMLCLQLSNDRTATANP